MPGEVNELPLAGCASVGGWFWTIVSSFRIVPLAVAVEITVAAGLALDSVTVNPSSGSPTVSPLTGMKIVCVVTPGPKVTVPKGARRR